MKEVKRPTLKEMIGYQFNADIPVEYQQNVYNPFTFFIVTAFVFLIFAFDNRNGLIFALSLLTFLGYQFYRTLRTIQGIDLERRTPNQVQENDQVDLDYYISNGSHYNIDDVFLLDNFTGTRKKRVGIFSNDKFKSGIKKKFTVNVPVNEGMGVKSFSNLRMVYSDPLKIFNFEISENQIEEMEVFPEVKTIPEVKIPYGQFSVHFGDQDIASRGDSVNFLGVRPYVYGDPVKRINWRQSVKTGETIVNYYEKNINKSIVILMNTDYRLHSGEGHFSTHEYLRDFALSIMEQNISTGNEITLITNEKQYPTGAGQKFVNQMEMEMFNLNLIYDEHAQDFVERMGRSRKNYASDGSSIIYLTPLVPGTLFDRNMRALRRLAMDGFTIQTVWVNPFNYLAERVKFGSDNSIKHRQTYANKEERKWKNELKNASIKYLPLEINELPLEDEVKRAMESVWKER